MSTVSEDIAALYVEITGNTETGGTNVPLQESVEHICDYRKFIFVMENGKWKISDILILDTTLTLVRKIDLTTV